MKIKLTPTVHQEIDITEITLSVLKVMIKPYNDFLKQMLKDGRVTEAELERLRKQFSERGDRFDELVEEEMHGGGGGAGEASGGGEAGGGGGGEIEHEISGQR